LFVGTPPYVWLENAYVNSGNIITFLNCNTAGTPAPCVPGRSDEHQYVPKRLGLEAHRRCELPGKRSEVPAAPARSLAYDRRLPWNLVATLEGLYSKTLNQLFFVSKNVTDPVGTGQGGRTLYITTVTPGDRQS
jgi:hypothetical protein